MNDLDVFPIKFFEHDLPKEYCDDLLKEIKDKHPTSAVYYTDYDDPVKLDLITVLERDLRITFEHAGLEFKLSQYWVSIYRDDAMHPPHTHKENVFHRDNYSGILYLTDIGSTSFYNPSTCMFQKNSLKIQSEYGKIVMFPSDMIHWAEPTRSDKYRYVVPFNFQLYFAS